MRVIQNYLQTQTSYRTVSDSMYDKIGEWLTWYQNAGGSVVSEGAAESMLKYRRLGLAKKVCEDWADLLMNEGISVTAGSFDSRLNQILEENHFTVRAKRMLETSFALGTGAFTEYRDPDGNIRLDCIRGDMICPITWNGGEITECAFGSVRTVNGNDYIYLQIHRKGMPGSGENSSLYYIENKYLDAVTGETAELPTGMQEVVPTGCNMPMFQIITPNIVNTQEPDSPMGSSVYADAIDLIEGCDLIYDSYMNEYILGRKRLLVPYSAARMMQTQNEGGAMPVFDPNAAVYFTMPGEQERDLKLTEQDMNIRITEHEQGLQKCLELLSLKCGMGAGWYRLKDGRVKADRGSIADKTDLYRNLQKHRIPIKMAVRAMVKCLHFLENATDEIAVQVYFDDSVLEDPDTVVDRNIRLVQAGLRSKQTAIREIMKCSKEEAEQELALIAANPQKEVLI